MSITRRDFLNGMAITIAAGLTPWQALRASPQALTQSLYYPPTLTGLRGNHPGSFEAAHLLGREGKHFDPKSAPIEDRFDLVVVGAGISGLAAACFWQQLHGKSSAFCCSITMMILAGTPSATNSTLKAKRYSATAAVNLSNRRALTLAPSQWGC